MKRIVLLLLACSVFGSAAAQTLTLSGTSYTQNFNGLSGGLPLGWHVFTFPTSSSLGVIQDTSSKLTLSPSSNLVKWTNNTGGFKNYASASNSAVFSSFGEDSAAQALSSDRALGLRQVANTGTPFPGSDPGAAFGLLLSNTAGLASFNISFKLQSLDSTASRTTTWRVDYGLGVIPTTFTTAGTGTYTTGGNTYSNNTINVSFSSGINNQGGLVWIRVVTLTATTGSGNRPSSAIDDVNLSWTGTAIVNPRPNILSLSPAPGATSVPAASNLLISFDRNIKKGTGNIYVKNRKTQTIQTIAASSANVTVSGKAATVTGVGLQFGITYHVTFDSTVFDTAGYRPTGIYDTSLWRFSTSNVGIGSIAQAATLPVRMVNPAGNGTLTLLCTIPQAAILVTTIYDLTGREVARHTYNAVKGENRFSLQTALPAGMYMIRVDDGRQWGISKALLE